MIVHDTQIDWPNGKGYRPCSSEYAKAYDDKELAFGELCEQDALRPRDRDPGYAELYERAHRLEDHCHALREAGHVGTPVQY